MSGTSKISGWGKFPKFIEASEKNQDDVLKGETIIPRGNGRSYGDASMQCHIWKAADSSVKIEGSIATCGASATIGDVLQKSIPLGLMLPTLPGTAFVTIGGAIGFDIHGKSHITQGSFGSSVLALNMLLHDGSKTICSRTENNGLFYATVGGMGLTGLIQSCTIQLEEVSGDSITETKTVCKDWQSAVDMLIKDDAKYTIIWHNFFTDQCIYTSAEIQKGNQPFKWKKAKLKIPSWIPFSPLTESTMGIYSKRRFAKESKFGTRNVALQEFFFPLDSITNWNNLYGKNGFIQYQYLIPFGDHIATMELINNEIRKADIIPFLSVIKKLGKSKSDGLMAFCSEGITVALDFKPNTTTLNLLHRLDAIVLSSGGRVNLAKDARIAVSNFRKMYPNLGEFQKSLEVYNPDTKFSSLLSTRMELTQNNNSTMKKSVLILGANSDIAKPTAQEFSNNGYHVILASRNVSALQAFADQNVPDAEVHEFDVTKLDSHNDFLTKFETPDVVVAAFGLLHDNEKSLAETAAAIGVINTNFTGAVSILGKIALKFEEKGTGSILGLSSVAAIRGRASNVIYCASKAGFDSYLSGLRNKYAKTEIKIVTIRPGFVQTKMLGDMETPGPLTADPVKLAKRIYGLRDSSRSIVYFKPIWRTVMLVIRSIPEPLFKKLKL
jgi:decaprenylphospho-beta-D-ribofuranose 2-oxidase